MRSFINAIKPTTRPPTMAEPSRSRRRFTATVGAAVAASAGVGSVGLAAIAGMFYFSPRSQSQHIDIKSAELRQLDNRWLFDCRATIDLPSEIRSGLENGVPLQFVVSLEVTKSVEWWPDEVLLQADRRFRLVYYELTRHYRVQSVEDDENVNKRSLLSAMDELGTLRSLDVTDRVKNAAELANPLIEKRAKVTILLDQNFLPLPLQPLFSSEWRLASEEFVWPLS